MKPVSIKEYREKEVRKLRKELQGLYRRHIDLGYRELEKPIRHGWFMELTIRRNIERYKFKPEIEEIVEKLERSFWGRTKEEAQKSWHNAQSKYLIYKDVPTIGPKTYRKLSEKAKRHCTVFFYRIEKKWRRRYYVRIPKNVYRIRFRRAYVTHSKIIDPEIQRRIALIYQQMDKPGWYDIANRGNRYCDDWQTHPAKRDRKHIRGKLREHRYGSLEEISQEY